MPTRGDKIGQGKANAARFLEEHPDIANEIENQIRHQTMGVPLAVVEAAPMESGEASAE